MERWTKKPVTIEAVLWTGANIDNVGAFLGGRNYNWDKFHGLAIHTLEGNHQANVGDYIIKGVKGEFYPCKPDIFEMTYVRAASTPEAAARSEDPNGFDDWFDRVAKHAAYTKALIEAAWLNGHAEGAAAALAKPPSGENVLREALSYACEVLNAYDPVGFKRWEPVNLLAGARLKLRNLPPSGEQDQSDAVCPVSGPQKPREIDWNDDKAVVKAVYPESRLVEMEDDSWRIYDSRNFLVGMPLNIGANSKAAAWKAARLHPDVKAFECRHNPAALQEPREGPDRGFTFFTEADRAVVNDLMREVEEHNGTREPAALPDKEEK